MSSVFQEGVRTGFWRLWTSWVNKDEEHGNRYRLVDQDLPPAWWTPLPQASFNVEDREWPATYRLEDLADGALRMNFETQDLFELKRWILG